MTNRNGRTLWHGLRARSATCMTNLAPWLGRSVAAVAAAALLAVVAGTVPAAAQVDPLPGPPKFLAFPSTDPGVVVTQGWYYDVTGLKTVYCSFPGGDIAGYGRHCAIDYRKRAANSNRNTTFPVTAAASGYAYRRSDNPWGAITIEHDQADAEGRKYCTRYLHMDQRRYTFPANTAVWVNQGQVIGWAGRTNTSSIHLHFQVRVGGCSGEPVDPYNISDTLLSSQVAPVKQYYPGWQNFAGCGPNALWLSCDR